MRKLENSTSESNADLSKSHDDAGSGNYARGSDKETFIRRAFDENPTKGVELLFQHYYSPLCNHAVRIVYSKSVAHDLVSDIFLVFWQQQLHKTITSSFRAYLFTAVRNRSIKYIQREFTKSASAQSSLKNIDSIDYSTPHQILQYNELVKKIEKGIHGLSPQCQKVFLMNRFDGLKYQEIARELKLSLKTVEAHMSKALDLMRKVLKDQLMFFLVLLILG